MKYLVVFFDWLTRPKRVYSFGGSSFYVPNNSISLRNRMGNVYSFTYDKVKQNSLGMWVRTGSNLGSSVELEEVVFYAYGRH